MNINDLTIALLFLAGARFIGFLMFLMLYLQKKKIQHIVLAFGWFIYMLGPVFNLLNYNPNFEGINPMQGFFAPVGTYILMLSIVLYLRKLSNLTIILLIAAFFIPALILIIVLPELNGLVTTAVQGTFLIGILLLVLFRRNDIQKSKSNLSFYWLCFTLVFGLVHAAGFTLFFKQAPVSLKFAVTFIVNISLLEFFIYLDWENAFANLEKSDAKFRFLFKTAPTALFDADLSVLRNIVTEIKEKNNDDIEKYYQKNPESLINITSKIKINYANSKTLELFEAETIGELESNLDNLFMEETYPDLLRFMVEIPFKQEFSSLETTIRTLSGRKKEVLLNCSHNDDFFKEPRSIISLIDITEKNEIQKEIAESLREKEILLQEVHHRVKNNLMIISSILGFQNHHTDDKKIKDIIRSIENRINTMAIVHEQLYRSRNLKEINFSDYIKELVDGIDTSFVDSHNKVAVSYLMEPLYLDINILIPIGMLINEIITNSYKHAFINAETPRIHIEMHVVNKKGNLLINDNGCGFSKKIFKKDVTSTGFIIIKALTEQLEADITLNIRSGTEYLISIPLSMK